LQLTTIITDFRLAGYIGHLSCYPVLQRSYYAVPYWAMPLYVYMSGSYSGTVLGIIALQLINSKLQTHKHFLQHFIYRCLKFTQNLRYSSPRVVFWFVAM